MKKEPCFYWCHSSDCTEPVLYAISPAPGSEVYYLGQSGHKEPKWFRSTCYDERTLLTQFNNPQSGACNFFAVAACDLLFDGVDVPPLPELPQPPHVLLTPNPVKWTGGIFDGPPSYHNIESTAKLASDIADAGRYQERRSAIQHLRVLAYALEKSIPAGK